MRAGVRKDSSEGAQQQEEEDEGEQGSEPRAYQAGCLAEGFPETFETALQARTQAT